MAVYATLVAVPLAVAEEIERGLRESGAGRSCHVLRVSGESALPAGAVTEGVLVAWDAGGPLEDAVAACQRLHEARVASRTHLVVLTRRPPSETEALAEAGADECVAPPGTGWGARLVALRRRLALARMSSVSTLAAGVAHEINNPLAYVMSNLSYLRERLAWPGPGPEQLPELREVVAEAEEGAGRVCAIVRDLRALARAQEVARASGGGGAWHGERLAPGAEAAPGALPAPKRGGPRRRLLLIDDEPSVGSAVSRLVRDVYEVRAVQDAREALRLLSSGERFDAILCDLMMPGMSGMDFVTELERRAPELALRTGLMTGGAFTEQAIEFVGRHPKEVLEKPFERDRLCTFVEHLLQ
jgi:CheY-like chemotaxis protein